MPITACTVSDVLKDAQGNLLTSTVLTFERMASLQGLEAEHLISPVITPSLAASVSVTTHASTAAFSIDLMPGVYAVTYQGKAGLERVTATVPLQSTSYLRDIIGQATAIDSTLVQRAEDAADAAEASAEAALAVVNAYFPPIEYVATAGQTQFALPAGITTTDNLQVEVIVEGLTQHDISFTGSSPILAVIPASPALDAGARVVVIGRYTIGEQAVLDAAAQTAADAAATAADAIATAADRVQTGIDAAAAETAADTAAAIVGSGDGLFPGGTAAAPSIAFASDSNTGIYNAAANQIGFSTGGTLRALLSLTAFQIDEPITGTGVRGLGGLWCAYGGTANAIALTYGVGALTVGLKVRFRASAANTGAATISIDGLGAVACRTVTGVALPSGYIRTDVTTAAEYDGTYWVVDRANQRGSGPNGEYVRLADGTQICWNADFDIPYSSTTILSATWTFPAQFSERPACVGSRSTAVSAHTDVDRRDVGGINMAISSSPYSSVAAFIFTLPGVTIGATAEITNNSLVAYGRWF